MTAVSVGDFCDLDFRYSLTLSILNGVTSNHLNVWNNSLTMSLTRRMRDSDRSFSANRLTVFFVSLEAMVRRMLFVDFNGL